MDRLVKAMRRRDLMTLPLGTAIAWPVTAWAEQVFIGFLSSVSPEKLGHLVAAFRQGLKETGYIEGDNLAIDYRWAAGQYDRLPPLAADLVRSRVAVLVAHGGPPVLLAAKAATSTIPIVFLTADEPVRVGLVASLSRPGGNATGVSMFVASLWPKRLELLSELAPKARVIAALVNPNNPNAYPPIDEMEAAARTFGRQLIVVPATTEGEIDAAFASVGQRADAVLVGADPLFASRRDQIVALAARQALPAIYQWREDVAAGGLISYGPSLVDTHRQLGIYTGRILKGDRPADLPVMQPTKLELVVNLLTAKALGVTIPPLIFAGADEVIE